MEASPHFRPPDEELAARAAAGDGAAFEELYRRYAGALAAYARRIVRDRVEAEDVAQTAMLNAYRALVDGRAPRHVKPWLYKIAFHAALAARRRPVEVADELAEATRTEDAESRAVRESLLAGLAALPERQRHVYFLRELRGLTVSEIAAELSLRHEQVEQALFAAKNRLAEWISFGAPLTCGLVRTSTSLELSGVEQRAVKAHLRSCESCRGQVGTSGIASAVGSYLSGLLARIAGMLPAAGAPVAAKVGALATTAVIGAALGDPRLVRHLLPVASAASAAAVAPRDAVAGAAPASPEALRIALGGVVPAFVGGSARGGGGDRAPAALGDTLVVAAADGARGLGAGGTLAPASTTAGATTDGSTDATTTDQAAPDPTAAGDGSGGSGGADGSDSADSVDPGAADPSAGDASDPSTDPSATDGTSTDNSATADTATDPTATDTSTDPTATDTTTDPTATDASADPTATDTSTDPTATDASADPTATDTTAAP